MTCLFSCTTWLAGSQFPTRDWTWATTVKAPNSNHYTTRELPIPKKRFYKYLAVCVLVLVFPNSLKKYRFIVGLFESGYKQIRTTYLINSPLMQLDKIELDGWLDLASIFFSIFFFNKGFLRSVLHFLFFPFIFIIWRLITLQYCSRFCHTLTWISHGFTCVPHPDPPSHLPPYLIPLGLPSAPGPSTCLMHPTWTGDLFHPW